MGQNQNRAYQYKPPPPMVLPVPRVASGLPSASRPVLVRTEFAPIERRQSVIPGIIEGHRSIATIEPGPPMVSPSKSAGAQQISSHTSLHQHLMNPSLRVSQFQSNIPKVERTVVTQVDPFKQSSVYIKDSHVRSQQIVVPQTIKVKAPLLEESIQPKIVETVVVQEEIVNQPTFVPLPPPVVSRGPFIGPGIVIGSALPPGMPVPLFQYPSGVQTPSMIQTRVISPQVSRIPTPSLISGPAPMNIQQASVIAGPQPVPTQTNTQINPTLNESTQSRIPAPVALPAPTMVQSQPKRIPIQIKPLSSIIQSNPYAVQSDLNEMREGGQSRRFQQVYDLQIEHQQASPPVYTFDYDQQIVDAAL